MFEQCVDVPPLACENWVRDAVIPWLLPALILVSALIITLAVIWAWGKIERRFGCD